MAAADVQQQLVAQLEELQKDFQALRRQSKHDDLSDLLIQGPLNFVTRARAAIHRIAGRPSAYVDQCEEIMRYRTVMGPKAAYLNDVLSALRSDIEAGYLQSYTELVHSGLFADFLEMARHLLDQGYKDAAAVIAGSSLEAHLRQLCLKSGVDPENATGLPKKADQLNAELAKADVYSKLDQKNVTAWLDLRNKAAHGHYGQYEAGQVGLLISGVRDFITRNPA